MPLNIRNADHLNLPTEQVAPAISPSREPPSASAQELHARINQEIKNAAQNLDQIVGASNFTTQTDGTTTRINFGDGINGAKLPTGPIAEAGYRTGSGDAGNNPTPGATQESQLADILKSELGVSGPSAQELANAIARGGQAGTGFALSIAEAIADLHSSGTDETNQTGPQDPAVGPAATRSHDFASVIEHEKIRHIKP